MRTPPDNPLSWAWLSEQLQGTSWSPAAREVGLWALGRLRAELGPRWPPAWRQPGGAPPQITSSYWALAGLSGTVQMALAFERLRGCEGIPAIRKAMIRGADPARLASPSLQLAQAALARSAGYQVRLEPLIEGAKTRADLQIDGIDVTIGVEVFALLRDERTMRASAWLDVAREELRQLGEQFGVDFQGAIDEPPEKGDLSAWLAEVSRYVKMSASGIALPPLRSGGVTVAVQPAQGPGGGSSFRMPMVSFGERLGMRLAGKARQTERSGASWLLIDSLDQLWHMTAWSRQPISAKAEQLAGLLQAELADAPHILGVTISDGAILMRPEGSEQTIEGEGFVALARRSDAWHIRESVIIPLRPGAKDGVRLWRSILDAESGWVGSELRRHGLILPPELNSESGLRGGRPPGGGRSKPARRGP
jgi:hypothetical protein